ncbi:MAG: DUF5686 and carboxypeptidase regulatory-like domain-containing protein [Bacteroidales bacterium]|nr:DUF5686 and carboxypeptidase regulatory-like domain-containing protein [Bacteroidales bacterium]
MSFFRGTLLVSLFEIIFCTLLQGAVFRGKISDESGLPVPYASIYLQEAAIGVSADVNGEFHITLKPGTYTCEVSSLGYRREKFNITIDKESLFRAIVLKEEHYLLDDLYFKGNQQDRANFVMRRAIARAPYHRQQVRSYESSVYMKGTMKITRIPAIIKMQTGKTKSNLVLNKLFLLESHSQITYTYPNSYKENITAYSSTIPAEIDPGNVTGVQRTSIYNKEFFGKLSPLAPNAFNYYKFVYEGITNESGKIVNKIRVVPKKGDTKLLSGHIYIVDDTWNVFYLDVVSKESGVTTDIRINYNQVKPSLLIPTAYVLDITVDMLGIKAQGRYNSSITYSKVNGNGDEQESSLAQPPAAPVNVAQNLTDREAKRTARRVEKELNEEIAVARSETQLKRRGGESLEIKRDTSIRRVVDSLAKQRDSLYWSTIRKLPLREEEVISYRQADSLKDEFRRVFEEDSVKKVNRSTGNKILDKILYESRFKAGERVTYGFGGLSKVVGDFNFVDGYHIGQNLYLKYQKDKNKALVATSSLYYSTLRECLIWRSDLSLTYLPMRLGRAEISIGEGSSDINNTTPISRFLNSYSSFLYGGNPIKFYSKSWVEMVNRIDISNGLRLNAGLAYNRRRPLANGELKSLFGKVPTPNEVDNIYGAISEKSSSLSYSASLVWTPQYYYRVTDGRKQYVRSAYPTFTIYTKATLPNQSNNHEYSSYGMAGVKVSQRLTTGLLSSLLYSIDVGGFYNNRRVFLEDYKHFGASDIVITETGFAGTFLLTDSYRMSTPKSWFTGFAEYKSEYLLLNRVPFINSPLLYEALHLKSLWLPDRGTVYIETGYSFGIKELIRGGVFVGFEGAKYSGAGFRVEIPLLVELSR